MPDNKTKIIDAAENMIRTGGYNGFSFREIANEIGIKSSSVHYYYPTKEDLALAVAIRYKENFIFALGDPKPDGSTPGSIIKHYSNLFQTAFDTSGKVCLCGMLSTEVQLLPEKVRTAVIDFVDANVNWLQQALGLDEKGDSKPRSKEAAQWIYCSLQGAMSAAALTNDRSWIEAASRSALQRFFDIVEKSKK
jgi:TetR/AcrR family transcriptional regulator, transcriptional repressor for nem operon